MKTKQVTVVTENTQTSHIGIHWIGDTGTVTAVEKEAITGKENPNKENESDWKVNGHLYLNRDKVSFYLNRDKVSFLVELFFPL